MSWLNKAAHHAAHEVEHAAHQAGHAVQGAAHDVAAEMHRLGKRLVDAWHDTSQAAIHLYHDNMIGIRGLRGRERDKLHEVYQHSLPPMNRIVICSLISPVGRPFTLPASFIEEVGATLLGNPFALLLPLLVQLIGKRADLYGGIL